jgi:pimeloyl-ACP methyl ester carboxylesterase
MRRTVVAALIVLPAVLVGSCSGAVAEGGDLSTSTSSTAVAPATGGSPRIGVPVEPGTTVEGLVDVHGHDLYARCAGSGSPTVVYFTGWDNNGAKRGVEIAKGIERALGSELRVCSYERRNTGRSESVDGTQSPEDVIADIDGILEALGEDGPFVLLGASFGGLVASAYAVTHPDRVAAVVLLDASTIVDYDLDRQRGFVGMCGETNRSADANFSLEKLDNCLLAEWIDQRRAKEPDVPLAYLAAESPSTRDQGSEGDLQREAWVETWSPGSWRVVPAPHWMDESDTWLVAQAVREVIDLTN